MNRKQILSSATIAAFAAILLAWAPSTAYAGNGSFGSPATVITEFGCTLIEADGGGPGGSFTTDSHSVTNKNVSVLVCHFTDVPNDTGQAIKHSGFACGTSAGLTFDSRSVVDDEGNATLWCKIKAP